MKLNTLLNNYLEVYGFEAFKGLQEMSNPKGEKTILSTLSPAIMLGMGIMNTMPQYCHGVRYLMRLNRLLMLI